MRCTIALLFLTALATSATTVCAQKKLIIIGSSTSACYNVDPTTECYVGRLRSFFDKNSNGDTTVSSIAYGGANCYNGMPSTYVPPRPEPMYQPNTGANISIALAAHPDVVIVNYPTNAYDVLSVPEIMYCLRTMRDSANKQGVPCFVTTSQPRTSPSSFNTSEIKKKLAEIKDSVLLEFGSFALDFYTGLINPADSSILYDSGDQIHMNATGHDAMYQRVLAKNIFLAALPATFLQFNAVYKNDANIISWLVAKETDVVNYEIQRSTDGASFWKIATIPANNNSTTNTQYQYADDQPIKGWDYYKVVIVDRDGKKYPSPVMKLYNNPGKLSLLKAYTSSSLQLVLELENKDAQNAHIQLFNNLGMVVTETVKKITAGTTMLYITVPPLSNGIYHVKISTPGETVTASFIR